MACLLHAHHEAIVHCGAVLLGTLAQVVVQHLQISQVLLETPSTKTELQKRPKCGV